MNTDEMSDDELLIDVDRSELDLVQELATEHDVTVVETTEAGFALEAATVSIMLIGATATFLRALEQRRGGQVIDLRPGAERERYRDRELRFDIIEIRRADGTVELTVAAPQDTLSEVLATLRSITVDVAKAGIDAAAAAAKAAVGDRASVVVRPAVA